MVKYVEYTCLALLLVETFGAILGVKRWFKSRSHEKVFTAYLMASAIIGIIGYWRIKVGHPNAWSVHFWILALLALLGPWSILRVMPSRAKLSKSMLTLGLVLWFACAFALGIGQYYTYAHLYAAVFLFSCSLCATKNDWAFTAAVAAEIMLCAVSLYWHAQCPLFWAVRNVVWCVAIAISCIHKPKNLYTFKRRA